MLTTWSSQQWSGSGPISNWILATGLWNDSGMWEDDAVWID